MAVSSPSLLVSEARCVGSKLSQSCVSLSSCKSYLGSEFTWQ